MCKAKKAIYILKKQEKIIISDNCDQTDLNKTSDYLRRYLGTESKIYLAFDKIDIRKEINVAYEKESASKSIKAAIGYIEDNGVYRDWKIWHTAFFTFGAAILGAIISNAKDIVKIILRLLHMPFQ